MKKDSLIKKPLQVSLQRFIDTITQVKMGQVIL